ncbi:putative RING/U-box superfamily protein [Hibiscus syriacus]|uniref:RING-type E3 ubiquitin transferase n=1 Tax=Hibiscus syriacus TaxID=106335 RepID=A0A6A3B2A5_HIBSY|nr:putative RING-H2 finger protein ATL21A [Hibiscus syriacus]KAE8710811.1 putative RING/U-box superfamily protein [Hibiscus syriacus]
MNLFETIFFIFLLSSLRPSTSSEICRVSCGIQSIRFPFRLDNQADRCGYPRFNLSCKNQSETVLSLPFSGDFDVVNIDYMFQNIWINDPDYCVPQRLLQGLNLSLTPFSLLYPRSFTFFNCSFAASSELPEAKYISCLSGGNFSVVAIPVERLDLSTSFSTSCSEIATVPVPVSWTGWLNPGNGIMLTWNEPNCMFCERRAGNCMFKSDTGLDVGCSDGFSNGLPRRAKYGIMFGVGIPVLFIIGLVIYLRKKAESYDLHHPNRTEPLSNSIAPILDALAKGLDGKTIEAYPVTLLGESRRLPSLNHNTCPICLDEYQAKEKLRTIPDCKHYFHADCIDEWLKLNAACPLCRNTP